MICYKQYTEKAFLRYEVSHELSCSFSIQMFAHSNDMETSQPRPLNLQSWNSPDLFRLNRS